MGVATEGDGGYMSSSLGLEFWGDVPQKMRFLKIFFLNIYRKVGIFRYFWNKVGEIRGEIRIWG